MPKPYLFETDLHYLRSLVRMDHRRMERRRAALAKKWEEDAQLDKVNAKIAHIEELYRRLHPEGNPPWDEEKEPIEIKTQTHQ